MTYEFRVAIITPLQVGYEAVETLALEGRAPSNTPTSLQVTYSLDHILLSWNPPEWLHRHGIFEAYELKCYSPTVVGSIQHNTTGSQGDMLQSYTSSQYSRYQQSQHQQQQQQQHQNFNITLLNSRIQWPISAPNDLVNIIPWPNGQIQLSIPQDFSYKFRGEVDNSETNQNDNNNNNNNEVYACIIRARNMYGTGPWSLEKIILPRKPCEFMFRFFL
ncbi:unnamed protein product [Trichobilharzia regenti]|nr:unnamed protein product [Trichobilharzia regenti]